MVGWSADSLDLILLATSTPDDLFGSAPRLQARLNATSAAAFDLTAACSGFLFALITAAQYLRSGAMQRIWSSVLISSVVGWTGTTGAPVFCLAMALVLLCLRLASINPMTWRASCCAQT